MASSITYELPGEAVTILRGRPRNQFKEVVPMKSMVITARVAAVLAAASPLLVLGACAGSKPPIEAPAPGIVAAAPAPAPTAPVAPSPPPTTGNISISGEILRSCGISDRDAYFPFDSATLETQDIAPLNALATCFSSGPLKGRAMRLVGHADPRGPDDYNIALGLRRADSVERYLDHRGVQHRNVDTSSRGATDATGTDEAGWAKDRRVDVMLGT